jgi:hypothetical protein
VLHDVDRRWDDHGAMRTHDTPTGSSVSSALKLSSPALLLATLLATAYVLYPIPTGDMPAQEFRAHIFDRVGFATWNNFWFGGHHLPGYSVLFPALAGWTTPPLVGAGSLVVATLLFTNLVIDRWPDVWPATSLFTVGVTLNLVAARLTFVLGVAIGLGAITAAVARRPLLAGLLAGLTSAASPVAGAFVALLGASAVCARPSERDVRVPGLALVFGGLGVVVVLATTFPEGGMFPFPLVSLLPTLVFVGTCALIVPNRERVVRAVLGAYVLVCLGLFFVPTAMGGNVVRLGTLAAGPVLVASTGRRRPGVVAVLSISMLLWQAQAPVSDLLELRDDPTVHRSFYDPLIGYLQDEWIQDGPFRIEIPATGNHWETAIVAEDIPLARGWERQLDRELNPLFYEDTLDETSYGAWLDDNAVRFVALPLVEDHVFEDAGIAEAELVRGGVVGLRLVWASPDWRVYENVDGGAMVVGSGALTALDVDSFTVRADTLAPLTVRIRWSDHFTASPAEACVEPTPDGWTVIRPAARGTMVVRSSVDVDAAVPGTPSCT